MPQLLSKAEVTKYHPLRARLRLWFRWTLCAAIACALTGVVVSVSVSYLIGGPTVYSPAGGALQAAEPPRSIAPPPQPIELTVMTLNVAHGRAQGRHQALLDKETIQANLDQIAAKLLAISPDIVALQEADGPSLWSGRFDHVAHLAEQAELDHHYRGQHVQGLKLAYGTALLADTPLENTASITFDPNPPTFPKGMVVAQVEVPGLGPVTVASVHLDFVRRSARREQTERIIEELAQRSRPLIVLGDFNCDWDDESTLPDLAERLGLTAFEPTDETATFSKLGKRLDWILVSEGIEFVDYQVGNGGLSDHRAVVARLRFGPEK